MPRFLKISWVFFGIIIQGSAVASTYPLSAFTPGKTCNKKDPDFYGYDYPAKVARCERNVSYSDKVKIAKIYQVEESDWKNYEFDHLIPLCAGGSNDASNIWPQPLDEAHEKDVVENDVCVKLRKGMMDQAEAIKRVWDWFEERGATRPERLPISGF